MVFLLIFFPEIRSHNAIRSLCDALFASGQMMSLLFSVRGSDRAFAAYVTMSSVAFAKPALKKLVQVFG